MSDLRVGISAQEARELSMEDMGLGEYITVYIERYARRGHNFCRIHIDRGWDELGEIREDMRTLGFETQISKSSDGKVRQLYVEW